MWKQYQTWLPKLCEQGHVGLITRKALLGISAHSIHASCWGSQSHQLAGRVELAKITSKYASAWLRPAAYLQRTPCTVFAT
jgi:hypothetical protein